MTLHLDDVEALRDHAYELQEAIPPVYMETNDPRIATLRAMVNNIVGFMDDWRIDMLDKQDDEEQAWVDEHGS